VRSKIVLPPILSKHLGVLLVKGRSLADTPAAKITDFIFMILVLMRDQLSIEGNRIAWQEYFRQVEYLLHIYQFG
jgi:hypothetical protein